MTTVQAGPADGPRGPVRTFLQMRAKPGREAEFESAWLLVAAQIAKVPGQIRQDLLRGTANSRDFTIVSEWTDRTALEAFGTSPLRDRLTVALRDLREGAERMTYDVLHSVEGQPEPGIRVLVTTTVRPGEETTFEQAYAVVAGQMRGTPGHVREELLHEPGAPTYHLLAEWTSRAAFLTWVKAPKHTDKTGPMIPFLMREFSRRIFEIVARPMESVTAATAAQSLPAHMPALLTSSGPAPMAAQPAGDTGVLIVGAGPTGLTLAVELARRGVAFRLIDARTDPNTSADKAIGVHCRTMEIWEDQGIVAEAIDRGSWLEGQILTVNGKQTARVEWDVPELPYAHLGLPQYETEDLLTARLAELGGRIETGFKLDGFEQDDDGVTARVSGPDGSATCRAQYVVGCDGAHSVVRKTLGLEFQPGAGRFPQLFMLCDVDVDFGMPPGYLLRFIAEEGGELRGMLVCVPLKGEHRYRVATMAPPRIMAEQMRQDVPAGFSAELDSPRLEDLQLALDRLAPPGTTASNLRWSSVFRINHGILDTYRVGRAFVAGDAAHLHPPAGGQGMNTGIQDAYNLGWKLALAIAGRAGDGLLDSYQAERLPAGVAVVDRAVQIAFTDEMDFEDQKQQFLHEMHMLLSYSASPVVGEVLDWELTSGPGKGDRAPDVHGLTRHGVGHAGRLFDLFSGSGGTGHTLLLYADTDTTPAEFADAQSAVHGWLEKYPDVLSGLVIAAPDAKLAGVTLPTWTDSLGQYRAAYSPGGISVYVIRPDGHVGFRSCPVFPVALGDHLGVVLAG